MTIISLISDATYAYDGDSDATDDHGIRQELHQRDIGIELLDIVRKHYYSLVPDNQKSDTCDD